MVKKKIVFRKMDSWKVPKKYSTPRSAPEIAPKSCPEGYFQGPSRVPRSLILTSVLGRGQFSLPNSTLLPNHTLVGYETVRISLIGVCISSLPLDLRLPCYRHDKHILSPVVVAAKRLLSRNRLVATLHCKIHPALRLPQMLPGKAQS